MDAAGVVVRTTNQIAAGDRVTTRLSDGVFISRVESSATTNATQTKK
jgi:exonuclease VII large subunit